MKTFRDLLSEVSQPRGEDEKNFKDKHITVKKKHPVAGDNVFDGGTKKAPKRLADYDVGEDELVYEGSFDVPTAEGGEYDEEESHKKYKRGNRSTPLRRESKMDPVGQEDDDIDNDGNVDSSDEYLHARRRAIKKAMKKEEVESLDEVSKDLLGRYATKAHNRGDMAARMSDHGRVKDMANIANRRYSGIQKAISKLSGRARVNATESVEELDEAKMTDAEVLSAAKALAKNGKDDKTKAFGKGLVDFYDKEGSFTPAQVGGLQNIMKNASFQMAAESVKLNELSPNKLHAYIKKALDNKGMHDRTIGSSGYKDRDSKRKSANRLAGITSASGRLADKANADMYEAELDEVTRTAIKKTISYVGPDGKARARNVPIKKVGRDDYGQEKIRTNESFINEAFKAGTVRLNDGSSVSLKSEDAKLLNQMFNDLNDRNRNTMKNTLMSDKNGFNEILSFAREAI
jgi:hypothetical protein